MLQDILDWYIFFIIQERETKKTCLFGSQRIYEWKKEKMYLHPQLD